MRWYRGIRWKRAWGMNMRKSALLLAVLLAASFATTADAAKRKKHRAAPPVAASSMKVNEQSAAFVRDALCPFCMAQPAAKKPMRHAKKKGKKKG